MFSNVLSHKAISSRYFWTQTLENVIFGLETLENVILMFFNCKNVP